MSTPHWKAFLDPDARGGRFLPWKEVARETGLSRTTAWRLQKRDDFPAPYAISPGRVGYREDEVEAWRRSRDLRGGNPPPSPMATKPPPNLALATVKPAPVALPPPPLLVPRPVAREAPPVRSGGTAKAGRRRSEHAKAIAQQMLFDF